MTSFRVYKFPSGARRAIGGRRLAGTVAVRLRRVSWEEGPGDVEMRVVGGERGRETK